jgi:hypothetical protein
MRDVARPDLDDRTKFVKQHGHRDVDLLTASSLKMGRFGRMFRHLPVHEHQNDDLLRLARRMDAPPGSREDNADIPAGYTYLGQFIGHDITFDPTSSLQRQNDPDALHNFRTPRFDLDSVYGRGPSDQPYLYDHDDGTIKMKLGESVGAVPGETSGMGPDLPRSEPRRRNGTSVHSDQNTPISQLHLTMLQFHNCVTDFLRGSPHHTDEALFQEAQRLVRWHYQWVVVNDYLRRVVGDEIVDDVLGVKRFVVGSRDRNWLAKLLFRRKTVATEASIPRPTFHFYNPSNEAYIPVEFSVAAYRFGHSMVRDAYHINDFVRKRIRGPDGPVPIFLPDRPAHDELADLNGFRRLPPQWAVEWKYFFDLPGSGMRPQASKKIGVRLSEHLARMPASVAPGWPRSLAQRTLMRGRSMGLPAGTTVAKAMGVDALSPAQLDLEGELEGELAKHPPLWYYVLKEAEVIEKGRRLGPVGGRIVAEVLLGLLWKDPLSYLKAEPNWHPVKGIAREDGTFDMARLVEFAKTPSARRR